MPELRDLVATFAKIDARNTKYQIDLDRDVAWNRLAEPGIYFTPVMLAEHGVDAAVFDDHHEARDLLQWGLALDKCRAFEDLELNILGTVAASADDFAGSRSVELLVEEEDKHIALFRRYAAYLESQRPALAARFEEIDRPYRKARLLQTDRDASSEGYWSAMPHSTSEHFVFWLGVLMIEESTVHFYDRLMEASAVVQPAWLSAHAAHRREEIQHIVTDHYLLDTLDLESTARRVLAGMFARALDTKLQYLHGSGSVCQLVREVHPELPPFELGGGFLDSAFCHALRTAKAFAHTRESLWPPA
jgi:hypothetical protein